MAQKRPFGILVDEDDTKQVSMSTQEKRFCTDTLNKLKKSPFAFGFLEPVDPVSLNIPDYFDIIKRPMDLGTIQNKINIYQSKEQFIADVQLMLDNCFLYNNNADPICDQARELQKIFQKQLAKQKALEKEATLSMSQEEYKHCGMVIKEFKKPKHALLTWAFERPVDATAWGATDYYDIIKQPMDMMTIESKFSQSKYTNEDQFYNDYKLMFQNCYKYNPPNNDVHRLGKSFEDAFDKYWDKVHGIVREKVEKIPAEKKTEEKNIVIPPSSVQEETTEDIDIQTNSSTANEGRNVLRIKLNIKGPEEAKPPKSAVRIPGLALSKEPPKLAINQHPPLVEKKELTLQNQDKWLQQAKRRALEQQSIANKQTSSEDIPTPSIQKPAPPIQKPAPPIQKPAPPVQTQAPMFDIGDLYNKINEEKKLRQQQILEEKERREREERMRWEREKKRHEEQLIKRREFREQMMKKKERDRIQRMNILTERTVDISSQKMSSQKFESSILCKDLDWRELNNWQRETVDYRHIPVPAFIRRSPINLKELRSKLLSKSVRLKNAAHNTQQTTNQDSDMDID